MHWIAHRGNLFGRQPDRENSPAYIEEAIAQGFDVEVDVWFTDGRLFTGHDGPDYPIDLVFLYTHKRHLWCHAKDAATLTHLLRCAPELHVFSHDTDPIVLTSKAVPWAFPGQPINPQTICVMPERVRDAYTPDDLRTCAGICSDYVGWYKQRHNASNAECSIDARNSSPTRTRTTRLQMNRTHCPTNAPETCRTTMTPPSDPWPR